MTNIVVVLATEWVTVVDGGKSRKTPPWASKLKKICIPLVWVSEISLGFIELNIGEAGNRIDAYDGSVNAFKCFFNICVFGLYTSICLVYIVKINKQLKLGSGNKKGNKTIKSYLKAVVVVCSCATMYKCMGMMNWGW